MGCQSPISQNKTNTERGTHCTDKHWANGRIIRWGWILQGFLPSQQQAQVSSLARPVFRSSTYQAVTTPNAGQECLQVASQGICHSCVPRTVLQASCDRLHHTSENPWWTRGLWCGKIYQSVHENEHYCHINSQVIALIYWLIDLCNFFLA